MDTIKQSERKRRPNKIRDFADQQGRWYKDVIRETIDEAGKVSAAADVIGVNRVSLQRFVSKHNIEHKNRRKAGDEHGD